MGGRARRRRAPPRGAVGAVGAAGATEAAKPAEPEPFCAVCASKATRPVELPCGHRFCLECVEGAAREGPLRCPLCRRRCAAWLRRRKPDPDVPESPCRSDREPELEIPQTPVRRICAPGEIRSEFEAQAQRFAGERRLSQEKRNEEAEKLIRKLQEIEKAEKESKEIELRADEKYALELSKALNGSPDACGSGTNRSRPDPVGSEGRKKLTLDSYFKKTETQNKKQTALTSNDTSPELISTTARCGKFFKDFFNGKLWGTNVPVDNCDPSKSEPKIWEPRQTSPAGNRELSVHSGIVSQRKPCEDANEIEKPANVQVFTLDADIRSEDSLVQELSYFKPIHPVPIAKFSGKLIRSVAVKNPICREFYNDRMDEKFEVYKSIEKLRGKLSSKSSSKSAFACCHILPNLQKCDQTIKAKFKSNGCDTSTSDCVYSTPKRTSKRKRKITNYSQSCSKLNNNKHSDFQTPKKLRRFSLCDSSPLNKDDSDEEKSITIPLKRIVKNKTVISKSKVKNLNGNGFNIINNCNSTLSIPANSSRNLRSKNNCSSSNGIIPNGSNLYTSPDEKKSNGSINGKKVESMHLKPNSKVKLLIDEVDYSSLDLDPSIIAEQKRIEKLIIQEKNDFALAKKLQRQMAKNSVFTGYTVRTAAKRQTTLTEIVTPSKNMRI